MGLFYFCFGKGSYCIKILLIALLKGQMENAEVRKLKCRSEKKIRLSVFSALLTHDCVCRGLVAKG